MRSVLLLAAVMAATPSVVHAQGAGAQAEALFATGKELMAKGSYAEACDAFKASQQLEASTNTLLNLANCREKNEQLATAWGLFLQVERELRSKTDAQSKTLSKTARTRADKLAPLISKLTITVADANLAGLEVTRGGERVQRVTWGKAMPIDGGTYEVVARAPGRMTWTGSVSIAAKSDQKTVEIPVLPEASVTTTKKPVEPVVTTTTTTTPPLEPTETTGPIEPVDEPRRGGVALPIAFGIGALALGGAAVGFELWGRSLLADAEAALAGSVERDKAWESANRRHWAAQGLAIAAVASAGAAVFFYVTRDKGEEGPVVTPTASPTSAGVSVDWRW